MQVYPTCITLPSCQCDQTKIFWQSSLQTEYSTHSWLYNITTHSIVYSAPTETGKKMLLHSTKKIYKAYQCSSKKYLASIRMEGWDPEICTPVSLPSLLLLSDLPTAYGSICQKISRQKPHLITCNRNISRQNMFFFF